jgi:hypothetical protein
MGLGIVLILIGFFLSRWSIKLVIRTAIEKFDISIAVTCDDYLAIVAQIILFVASLYVFLFGIFKFATAFS